MVVYDARGIADDDPVAVLASWKLVLVGFEIGMDWN
jgi:hypothetical protein